MIQYNPAKNKLRKAYAQVKALKRFYKHLIVYLAVNLILLFSSNKFHFVLVSYEAIGEPKYLRWVDWNLLSTPIIWGVFVLLHAVYVFNWNLFRKWEDRQIQKILNKEN